MRLKYEAFIDGKRLSIGAMPSRVVLSRGELLYHIEHAEELRTALTALATTPEITGLRVVGEDPDRLWEWFQADHRFVQAAGGCVTDQQGRLLMIERLGKWDLPKGKVDPGEAIDAAAVREVQEECGLNKLVLGPKLCETWHTYERKGEQHLKRTDWYLMQGDASERLVAQSEEDITAVKWMTLAEVTEARRNTYPSLQAVIDAWAAAARDRA